MQPIEYWIQIVDKSLQAGVRLQIQMYSGEVSYEVNDLLSLDDTLIPFMWIEEAEADEISEFIAYLSQTQENIYHILARPGYKIIIHDKKAIPVH